MATHGKLIKRFEAKPNDFSWKEMVKLLNGFGYEEYEGRGSRKCFRGEGLPQIRLHKPHPDPTVKGYALKQVHALLKEAKIL